MKRFLLLFLVVLILGILIILFFPKENTITLDTSVDKIQVVTSFYPLAFFAEQIGNDLVNVTLLTPPGADPHSFEPSPKDVLSVNAADLFIFQGVLAGH